jgi:hypothetical protein
MGPKEVATWLWDKTPWYVKGLFAFIVVPNMLINGIIVLIWGLPWHSQTIHATIRPYEEKRDAQILNLQARQNLIDQHIGESIGRIEQHLSIVQAELMSRQRPYP